MRQIYTSPRLENIERIVALMREHGIETEIVNRNPWQGSDWKRFSYTKSSDRSEWPQVQVVHSEDQTAARRILREAGIEPPTRFADDLAATRTAGDTTRHHAVASRIKLLVLVLIGLIIAVAALTIRMR